MMRTSLFLLALSLGIAQVQPSAAQDAASDSSGAPAGGALQLFGNGNGVRGTVTALANGNFTILTDQNESYTVFYSANTRIMKNREPIDAATIHAGDMLLAAGEVDKKAKTVGAVFLYDVDAAEARKAREGFGKTWTAGKVQSIQDLKIVIERINDKQMQTVVVDENTSFQKHHESVTLGDLKVGDFISAQGAIQNNNFTAATLRIMEPRSGGHGVGQPGAGQPGAGPGGRPPWDQNPQ